MGNKMKKSKLIALVLVGSQIIGVSVFANTAVVPSISPELMLVQNVIALQGMTLSQDALQTQIASAMSDYLAQAPTEGQADRLSQALVDLKIYTPSQAQAFVAEAQSIEAKIDANATSESSLQAGLSQAVDQLSQLHPAGAEFSECSIGNGTRWVVAFTNPPSLGALISGIALYALGDHEVGKPLMIYGGLTFVAGSVALNLVDGKC
jgi:hypothetical protein